MIYMMECYLCKIHVLKTKITFNQRLNSHMKYKNNIHVILASKLLINKDTF